MFNKKTPYGIFGWVMIISSAIILIRMIFFHQSMTPTEWVLTFLIAIAFTIWSKGVWPS